MAQDVAAIVLASVLAAAVIFNTVLTYLLCHRINSVVDHVQTICGNVEPLLPAARLAGTLAEAGAAVQGMQHIVGAFSNFSTRRGETEMDSKGNSSSFGIGLLVGAVAGLVIALLYSPQSGKETRKLVKDKGHDLVEEAREKGHDVIEEAKGKADEIIRAARDKAEKIVAQAREKATELAAKANL